MPAAKNGSHLLKATQEHSPCHTERLWTHYETCWNVTKCHACHTKRCYTTFETSKSDHVYRTRQRQCHIALTLGVRGRLRTQKQCRANTSQPPDRQTKREPFATHSGKNVAFQTIGFPKVEDEWTVKWFGHLWGFKNCEVNRVKQPASSNRLGFRTRKVNALTKYR